MAAMNITNTLRALKESQTDGSQWDPSTSSPDAKRNRQDDNDAPTNPKLAQNEQLMVDAMMQGVGKMMDRKFERFETWTKSKFDNIQTQVDLVATTTDKGMNEMKKDADETKQHMKDLQATVTTMQHTLTQRGSDERAGDDEEERQLQVIAHGFAQNTEEQEIIKTITEIVHTNGFDDKVHEVFTFTNPATIGVIQFHRKQSIPTFFRRMKDVPIKMEGDKHMSFTKNETLEQRTIDKPLGFIKFHINSKLSIPLKQIKIEREKQIVKVQGRVVAKPGGAEDDFGLVFMREASEIKQEAKASMKKWMSKVDGSE